MNAERAVDGILRRYFLGTLEPEVRDDVDRRIFSDDRIFWEQLCLAEDELIDAYVIGDLDGSERQNFERCFLTTAERREKLAFARALKAHAEQAHVADTRSRYLPAGRLSVPTWAAAAAAVLLMVLPALFWQLAGPDAAPGDATAWLSAGLVRSVGSELERVRVPPGSKLVRLRLETEASEYSSYGATLHLASGEEVWSQGHLRPADFDGREGVELTLPAELLSPGDYYVRLRGVSPPGDPVVIGRYDFRATTE
ncbi:MAG TPA: hypothetical protein VD833_19620 [Vicinamibacterales bacterium]|nr:hypothetical protein [Vicinamibacterales bacterium]